MTQYSSSPIIEKPTEVTVIAIMTLVSGVSNIIATISWSLIIVLSTFGFGLLCVPLTILPAILGIFEIIYAANLLSATPKPVKPSQTIAILEICGILFLSVLSVVTGIIALVYYNNPKVKEYFYNLSAL